jgi:cell wall-associated protease
MKIIILLFLIVLLGCKTNKEFKPIILNKDIDTLLVNHKINKDLKNWEFKDVLLDSVVGISLYRAYDSILNNKDGKSVVVALIDMTVEVNHLGLKNSIWVNSEEKVNGIDDDKNGYVDDIRGWNYIGNNKGQNNEFVNYEYTRILKKYLPNFKDSIIVHKSLPDSLEYAIYIKALKKYNKRLEYAKNEVDYINMVSKSKSDAEKLISNYIKTNLTIEILDSLKRVYPKDAKLQSAIKRKSNFIKYGYSDEFVKDYKLKAKERINKLLNLDYNDRIIQEDNSDDINNIGYGSYILNSNTILLDHGTKMAGIIKKVGLKNEIQIMPLTISAYGDEHDKDIALAIRYAVDNGAKVINMSFAKEFSTNLNWVLEAIKYADKKNVLIVSAASNDGINLDKLKNRKFPNDHSLKNNIEVSNNFLTVGSSNYKFGKSFKSSFSNYGKNEVDVFAPGQQIHTTFPNNKFAISNGGTSCATALTSGVAALLFSYYPNLSASEVKNILMNSGLEFSIKVKTPIREDKQLETPFNQISKSGKILNIYNAVILAEKL